MHLTFPFRLRSTLVSSLLAASVIACGSSSDGPGATPGGDGGPPPDSTGVCDGTATVTIEVTGLPAGAEAHVMAHGPAGDQMRNADGKLTLEPGTYHFAAEDVVAADPIVRTVYRATYSKASIEVCETAAETVTVTYAPIASSGKLWASNANGSASTLGYAASSLGATASQAASVAAETQGSKGIAFDKDGNLWEIGSTTADPTLVRYAASSLGASGKKTADRKIELKGTGCSPAAQAIAFDATGNLWVSSLCEKKVLRVEASQLAADGEITPSVAVSGLTSPRGVAFDAAGNLWIADGAIRRIDAAKLAAGAAAADASLTIEDADSEHLAFDGAGDLWSVGGSQWNLSRIGKADLAAPGARVVTPAVKISLGVGALPHGIALDETGGVWVATGAGKFARLASAQLGTSSTYAAPTVPERVITSGDVGSAGSFALFPAPAALPLYSARP